MGARITGGTVCKQPGAGRVGLCRTGLRASGALPTGRRPAGVRPAGARPAGLRPEGLRRVLTVVALLMATGLLAPLVYAQEDSPVFPGVDADAVFVMGNVEYIVLHELAHLVIRDLDVPVIGSQESAADYVAALVLIQAGTFDPGAPPRARRYLIATANGLASSWDLFERTGRSANYWGSHALTIQRFYQIICLMYGSNPEAFASLPDRAGIPLERAAGCEDEYKRASSALAWLLETYGLHGSKAGANEAVDIEIVYDPPPTQASSRVLSAIQSNRMIENTVQLLQQNIALASSFRIVFRTCGQTQAGWLEGTRELYVCYELLDYYYSLARTRSARERQSLFDE